MNSEGKETKGISEKGEKIQNVILGVSNLYNLEVQSSQLSILELQGGHPEEEMAVKTCNNNSTDRLYIVRIATRVMISNERGRTL
jgi:hypothetical protein